MQADPTATPRRPPLWLRALRVLGTGGALGYLGILGVVYAKQDSMLYFPPDASATAFDFQIRRPDAVLGGWEIKQDPRRALVVFGGNGMAMQQWGVWARGCTSRSLVLVPYRGYEGNPGHFREGAVTADAVATTAWAQARYPNVAVLGISLGSGVAAQVSARRAGIDRVLLGTPYDRFDLVGRDHMAWALPQLIMHDDFDSAQAVQQSAVPIYGLRAKDDEIIAPARTRALQKAAGRGEWTTLPGSHNGVWSSAEACAWLREAST